MVIIYGLCLSTLIIRTFSLSIGFKIQTVTSFANLNLRRDHSTSSDVSFVKENPLTAALRRGTGGRSSFNGHVVTVFGATGCTGRKVVSRLCSQGCQVVIPYRCDPSTANQLKVAGDLGQIMFLVSDFTFLSHG